MELNEIHNLLDKYNNGQANDDEKAYVESWYLAQGDSTQFPQARDLLEDFFNSRKILHMHMHGKQSLVLLRRIIAGAAIVILCLSIGYYWHLRVTSRPTLKEQVVKSGIKPVGNKASLLLSNGKRIQLEDGKSGAVAEEAGIKIIKKANGQLVYEAIGGRASDLKNVLYNTIETPRGGQYQVNLPDGTKVWLNAGTVFRYPVCFGVAKERRVELTGEGYFEVAKDKRHPFIVHSPAQEVEVLGTHFNINAYIEEPAVKTTLVEGSVSVYTLNKKNVLNPVLLKPGQQAVLDTHGLVVHEADTEQEIAWKNGVFLFNDEPLELIMRRISRWYDVDIEYQGGDRKQLYGGGVSRYENVSKVLEKLELLGGIHFKIEGRRIYVMK
ncbi:hypothetical protein DBR11_08625 [Pedobacter sp. HMWF019]|uniref:FecR family protein n=1 Tax=Pedobacter sp. HMWF019 TaxID=2056856 RepID=UPI000D343CD6|nr:FecR family protein [Pedobacter sp. HMWF019]PTT00941.1 hypothetical protein DBR11_08625 [Pedobacter sp. HMWF019]